MRIVRRTIAFILLFVLLVVTWARSSVPPPDENLRIRVERLALPPQAIQARYLGPFRVEAAWHLLSLDWRFYGFSAMIPQRDGRLLAINDAGGYLWFSPPDAPPAKPFTGWFSFAESVGEKLSQDSESVVRDPVSGRYWLGVEGRNAIVRFNADKQEDGRVRPRLMRGWGNNTGPEAMARLPDGRFITVREITRSRWNARLHEAVLFDGDPIEQPDGHRFLFDGPDNFSVVDMALLPDGRALILMRRLLWPVSMRFAGRIVIADPAQIRPGKVWRSVPVAALASALPVDNFEAIGVVPQSDGRLTVWLMSDDNQMQLLQRTLLWKLSVDPRALPWPRPRG